MDVQYRRAKPDNCQQGFRDFRYYMKSVYIIHNDLSGASLEERLLTSFVKSTEELEIYITAVYCRVVKNPFRSKEGYIGLGLADLEVGDVIVILFGAFILFVLRSVE